ncbi:MAG TPA: c-type cytochrome [Polyangiaceae bacterium]|nr:c-type cytochrome [Polyangiaceae bacterium]
MRRWPILPLLLALSACGNHSPEPSPEPEPGERADRVPEAPEPPLREAVGEELFEPLPERVELDGDKVLLGRALFHDRRLSADETVACSTCHMLNHGGAEPRRFSVGVRGRIGPINAPTVLNSEHSFRQFWDGRAEDLLEQAAGPIANPIEMDGDWPTILERLGGDRDLSARMQAAYGDTGVSQENVLDAIVTYERSLSTPGTFDRWLRGDDDALSEQAQRGLRLFVSVGCSTCHRGRNVGGTMFRKLGLVHDYFERRGGRVTHADLGRFNVTEEPEDRHLFKVPTLRNVERTAPYFHDGSEPELAGAVQTMAYVQLGRELTNAQTEDIVAFLRSLTGPLPAGASPPRPGEPEEPEPETAATE